MTYHGVLANLHGPDRDDAVKAMDDDAEFDRWSREYEQKVQDQMAKAQGKRSGGGLRISQEEYLARYAKVHGGEEE
jgi:hypothetical protein